MRHHPAHLVLISLLLLVPTSGRERDDRSQTHPFIVDLEPMGVDGEVVSGDPHKPGGIYVIHIRELPGMIVRPISILKTNTSPLFRANGNWPTERLSTATSFDR